MISAGFNQVRKEQAKPPEKIGIGGFTTYATINERISGSRLLPTSVLESGRYANDDVIIEPLTIDLSIDVSDTFIELGESEPPVRETPDVSGVIAQFIPPRTESQVQRIASIVKSIVPVNASKSPASSTVTKNHREAFVQFLSDLYNSDAIINIQCRFKTYENMSLLSFGTDINNETQSIKAELTFQQLDFRDLEDVAVTARTPQGKTSPAAGKTTGSPSEKGVQGATSGKKEKSVLTSILGR